MSVDHYENFPVASVLLPRRLRTPVAHIYRFARTADDIADEGEHTAQQRLDLLALYSSRLDDIRHGVLMVPSEPHYAVFGPLASVIKEFSLPLAPFYDLLRAFKQDVTTQRYTDMGQLLTYCQYSANPIGRLMLHLYERHEPELVEMSDAICTGLQLCNFWQDVAIDWYKNRIYVPLDLLAQNGLDESYIGRRCELIRHADQDHRWHDLQARLVADARQRLKSGLPLCRALPGRMGLELKLIVLGGLRILEMLDRRSYDVFSQRPTLGKSDWLRLVWRSTHPLASI